MSSALERLADIVRQAETKTRAQKLGSEMQQAVDRFHACEERMRNADEKLQSVRPTRVRDLQKTESDETMLKELMRKLAHSLSNLQPDQQREAEREIAAAQEEIQVLRREAQTELDDVTHEHEVSRRELRGAREHYHTLRRELEQVLPHLAPQYVEIDRLYRETERFFPLGQIQALAREIDDGERHYSMLDPREQYAQLKIWIGRFRRLQAQAEADPSVVGEDDQGRLREIFPRLVGISKEFMPGYIEAFSRAFETDWDAYIAEAAEQLHQATDQASRDRELEARRREAMKQAPRLRPHSPDAAQHAALEEIRAHTQDLNAVLVGGEPDEEKRRQVEDYFAFEMLEWIASEAARPYPLRELEQRIREHDLDLILVLADRVDHIVTETLQDVCTSEGVACLLVEEGESPAQIAEVIRRRISRDQGNGSLVVIPTRN